MEIRATKIFCFGDFELDASKRLLRKGGQPVALNAKTFDLLLALVERHGQIVSKDDLLEQVWPGQFVEEGNLTVQISTLRKIFGERKDEHRYVVTVPGRGYSFVADVDQSQDGEMVVERHSLSRVLIDEELVTSEPSAQIRDPRPRFDSRVFLVVASSLLFILPAAFLFVRWNATPAADALPKSLAVKRLTANGRVSFAALSPDGKLFVYALKELEQNSLWLGSVEGGEDKLLRPSETGRYNDLAFSADGNFVLFTFSGADSRESVLYRTPTLGGAREKIRSNVVSFCVAPDGHRFAFGRYDPQTGTNQMVIAQVNNGDDVVVDLPGIRSFGSESVSWSTDGKSVSFGAAPDGQPHHQVFLANISDGSTRQITTYGWKEVVKTTWVSDSRQILVVAQEKNSHTSVSYSQIWQVDLPGGEVVQLTQDLSSYRSVLNATGNAFLTVELRQMNNIWVAPSSDLSKATQVTFGTFGKYDGLWGLDWTADGKIVFTSTDHQSQVISEMNADGSKIKQLTSPGYDDAMVNASPDGRYIVFQSTRGGGSDIWRMDSDGSDVIRLTTHGKNSQPFISPDSRFVYYKSDDGMYRVPIEGGSAEKMNARELSYFSLSPDGTRVAAGVGSRLVVLPINGGPPEKEFDLTRFGTVTSNTRWSVDGKMIAYRDRGFGYWLQPVDGGEPQRMVGLPMEKFYNFAWSKDGKYFAFVRGQEIRDVVLFRRSP